MENEVKYSLNNLPKGLKFLLCAFPFLGIVMISNIVDNDFYFLYKMGEYIFNNGFPVNDVLSMHTEMKLVVQQWLADVLYYKLYESLSINGVLMFTLIAYVLFISLYYKLCKLVSDNFIVSVVSTSIAGFCMSITYFTSRPQIVTYPVFILLFYSLESYIKTKKVYWLTVLPLLSIFLINWHASMWWLLFVFMLPYLVNSVPVNFKKLKIKQDSCCNTLALLFTMLVMFGCGFINPYGVDAVTYLFGSYGVDEINNIIQEMRPVSIAASNGKLLFLILFVFAIVFAFNNKKELKSRFFFLTIGTLVLALTSLKGIAYFLICSFFSMAYFLKDFDYEITVSNKKRNKKEKTKLAVLICVFALLLVTLIALLINGIPEDNEEKSQIDNLSSVVDVLDEEHTDDMVLYTDFNTGQYLEFRGYKPYIDGRAEVFLKANNESFDYFQEYSDSKYGRIYYKDFVDKYNFTHLIISNESKHLQISLSHDDDYEIIFENKDYTLFKLK